MFDADGFVTTHQVSQKEEIGKFFETHGFVVVRDVLDADEIKETVDEFFCSIDNGQAASDQDLERFYADQPFGRNFGIIGTGPDLNSIAQLNNRQNPKVYEAFSTVLKNNDLIVEHDRLGVLRPTFRDSGEKVEWRTRDRWIHLDCNPSTGDASIGGFKVEDCKFIDFKQTLVVQGLITLTDAREEDGGFHCIPGGHRFAHDWTERRLKEGKESMQVEPDDPIRAGVKKIPIRKGCLLVWNTLLFHGNHPNFSKEWRMVQYIRMLPSRVTFGRPRGATHFQPLCPEMKYYPPQFQMTALGKKLFGIVDDLKGNGIDESNIDQTILKHNDNNS